MMQPGLEKELSRPVPPLGLGTWDLRGAGCVRAVREALNIGYRHIDTAQMYENERAVGRAIRESGVSRENVFLTTKLWIDNLTRDRVLQTTEGSLKRLDTDYIDLLLIHWPNEQVPLAETLEAMEGLRNAGKARALGVSNFPTALWKRALELAPVRLNQVELHPWLEQAALTSFARARGLALVAYTPIAKGRVAKEAVIQRIGRAHGRTAVQVTLRWLVQQGIGAIPKAARREHLEENLGALDFELHADEMQAITALGRGLRLVDPFWAPAWDAH